MDEVFHQTQPLKHGPAHGVTDDLLFFFWHVMTLKQGSDRYCCARENRRKERYLQASKQSNYLWLGEGRGILPRGAAPAAPSRLSRSLACRASGLFGKRAIRLRSSFTPASRWPDSSRAKP